MLITFKSHKLTTFLIRAFTLKLLNQSLEKGTVPKKLFEKIESECNKKDGSLQNLKKVINLN